MSTSSSRTGSSSSCIDCPLRRRRMLEGFVGDGVEGGCRLTCISVESREQVPARVFERRLFGIVRRGVLVRQRGERGGAGTAVDAAGPGAFVPLASARGGSAYAASRVLLCVYPKHELDGAAHDTRLPLELAPLLDATLERVERIVEARGRATARAKVEALDAVLSESVAKAGLGALLQRDVASLLGLRAETVCRVLRARGAAKT